MIVLRDLLFIYLLILRITLSQCQDSPRFTRSILTLVVSEHENAGFHIDDLSNYVQYNDKSALMYDIDSAGDVYLNVEQTNGTITLKRKLDRENIGMHPIYIAYTSVLIGGVLAEASLKLLLVVSDVNDNTPTFSGPFVVDVPENIGIGSTVALLSASDEDQNEKGEVEISFALPTDVFALTSFPHNNSAKLTLLKKLDYEIAKSYTLKLTVTDLGIERFNSNSLVTINVQDVSDAKPIFLRSPYNEYVLENSSIDSSVLTVQAFDGDTGINNQILYSIVQNPDDDSRSFRIDQSTGVVYVANPLDREIKYTYSFVIKATEKTDISSSSEVSVVIFPEDVNDNAPKFQEKSYIIKVGENTPIGTVIYRDFIVSDADILPINKRFVYSLAPGYEKFSINPSTGDLSVNSELDYETNETINFTVFATESETTEKYSGNATVIIEIQNVNDNQPKFVSKAYTFTVTENVTTDDVLGYVKARDADSGVFGEVTYSIVGDSELFSVDSTSGALHVKNSLDFDTESAHQVTIAATDTSKFTSNSITTLVTVQLTDVNDNVPLFTNLPTDVLLEENLLTKDLIVLQASDKDYGKNSEIIFTLTNISYKTARVIVDATSGLVRILSPVDYEEIKLFEIAITVTDQGTPSLSSTSLLTVKIQDVNDNPPIFNQSVYSGTVMESPNAGVFIIQVVATDQDDGLNGELFYTITNGNNESIFEISNEGKISTINALDREMRDSYELTITTNDKGTPSMKSACKVLIQVLDTNDERPVFDQAEYTVNINESTAIGSYVIKISAHDKDLHRNSHLKFSIFSGNEQLHFVMDETSGIITLNDRLDRESKARYNLVVKAQDQGDNPLWRSVNVMINVIDNNDNVPIFTTNKQFYTFSAYENFLKTTIGYISASDEDGTSPSYFIVAGNEDNAFFMDEALGSLQTNKTLDREQKDFYNLTITAIDNGSPPLSSSIQCHVTVQDLNDNQPQFGKSVYHISVFENVTTNTSLLQVTASDPDLGLNGAVKFSLSNMGGDDVIFSMNGDGVLTVQQQLNYEVKKTYTLTVIAQDSGTSKLTSTATILVSVLDVNDNSPFYKGETTATVYEAQPRGTNFFQMKALDADEGNNANISFFLTNVTSVSGALSNTVSKDLFSVNPSSGMIATKAIFNRDVESQYKLTIQMEDHGYPSLSSHVEITVDVLDWNTHPPVFHNLPAILNISDVTSRGIPLIQVNATDADEGLNAEMYFRIVSGSDGHFRIDSKTGIIWTTSTSQERAVHPNYTLFIQAGVSPQFNNSTIIIRIVDNGNNKPVFEPNPNMFPQFYVTKVMENTPVNQTIFDLNATHTNNVGNTFLKYSIAQQDEGDYFQIDQFSGVVTFRKTINREQSGLNLDNGGLGVLTFIATVSTNDGEMLNVKITILVDDVNDNAPLFDKDVYVTGVSESAGINHVVTTVKATDPDLGYNGRVTYEIIEGDSKGYFTMLSNYTGTIIVSKTLNQERISQYNLTIKAIDDGDKTYGGSSLSSYTTVRIFVGDVNDNYPIFTENAYTANVPENVALGEVVLNVKATDKDTGNNGRVWYEVLSGDKYGHFVVNNHTGDIIVNNLIDRENISIYTLIVQASDYGFPILRTATVEVFITISDVNDNAPLFSSSYYEGTILENEPIGTTIEVTPDIKSFDVDVNNTLTYRFKESNESRFEINIETGVITTATIFDRETVRMYILPIRVQDQDGLFTIVNISIEVQDTNDNAPTFSSTVVNLTASEGLPIEAVVYVAHAEDLDVGTNSEIIYSLSKSSNVFEMIAETGELKLISQLDREQTTSYTIIIIATDKGSPPNQYNMTLTLYVGDTIDSKPYFDPPELSVNISESVPINATIFTVKAKDSDLNDVISYNITYTNANEYIFQINSTTGEVSLVKHLDREKKDFYTIYIQATDSAGLRSEKDALEVSLTVLDTNDNSPSFLNNDCRIDVTDETPDNSMIYIVSAIDHDLDMNGEVSYTLGPNVGHILRLNSSRGIIRKYGDLKPHVTESVNFTVTASDKGGDTLLSTTLWCVLNVINVGNEAPKFQQPTFKISVKENIENGSLVGSFPAAMETGNQRQMSYALYGSQELFKVDQTGSIYTTSILDQEKLSLLVFTLVAQESGTSNRGIAIFTVTITDVNDNYPTFTRDEYHFRVSEGASTSDVVGTVTALDKDTGFNSVIEYGLQPSPYSQFFRIDSSTGRIYPDKQLDRETQDEYEFTIRASDHGVPSLSAFIQVKIKINDINDNLPIFAKESYHVILPEDVIGGTMIAEVQATDKDIDKNGEILYSISQGNDGSHFVCGEISGVIFIAKPLDIETQPNFTLVVNATDKGMLPLTAAVMVTIELTDVNDVYPVFNKPMYTFSLYENSSLYAFIGSVYAIDYDVSNEYSTVYYDLKDSSSSMFSMEEDTGVIKLIGKLDYEEQTTYSLTAIAFNKISKNGNRTMISEVQVVINVLDINDNAPSFPPSCCSLNISEGAVVNDLLFQLKATDRDGKDNNEIFYIIQYGNSDEHFRLSSEGILKLHQTLDREEIDRFILRIKAVDNGIPSLFNFTDIYIRVTDINDEVPQFKELIIPEIPENSTVGTYITIILVEDKDLGVNSAVSYSIISGNVNGDLMLNSSTGLLSTAKELDYEKQRSYKLRIEVKDHGTPSLSSLKLFTVDVANINDNQPTFSKLQISVVVTENAPADTIVTIIEADDLDNDPINYFIIAGDDDQPFKMESATGILRTSKVLDREEKSKYVLIIEATNSNDILINRNRRSVNGAMVQTVEVIVGDQNDNAPRFVQKLFSRGFSEDAPSGSSVLQVHAVDADTGILHYEISNHRDKFSINLLTGWIVSAKRLTGQAGNMYELNTIVKDNEGIGNFSQDTTVVKIIILTDTQKVLLIMRSNPDLVRTNKTDFIEKLGNCTKYSITVDEIGYKKKENGEYDLEKTVLLFHGVESSTNKIAHRDNVIGDMDLNKECLEHFFLKWNVTTYTGRPIPLQVTSVNDDSWVIIGVVIACIIIVFIIIVVLVRRKRLKDKRMFKAAKAEKAAKEAGVRQTIHIHPLSSTIQLYEDPSIYQPKDSFTIPEDIPNHRKSDNGFEEANFSSFHGTLEPGYGNYYDDDEIEAELAKENVDSNPSDNLTLLDVLSKEGLGKDNKGGDFDDLESQATDGTESIMADEVFDDVVTVPIYDFSNFQDTKL